MSLTLVCFWLAVMTRSSWNQNQISLGSILTSVKSFCNFFFFKENTSGKSWPEEDLQMVSSNQGSLMRLFWAFCTDLILLLLQSRGEVIDGPVQAKLDIMCSSPPVSFTQLKNTWERGRISVLLWRKVSRSTSMNKEKQNNTLRFN